MLHNNFRRFCMDEYMNVLVLAHQNLQHFTTSQCIHTSLDAFKIMIVLQSNEVVLLHWMDLKCCFLCQRARLSLCWHFWSFLRYRLFPRGSRMQLREPTSESRFLGKPTESWSCSSQSTSRRTWAPCPSSETRTNWATAWPEETLDFKLGVTFLMFGMFSLIFFFFFF